MAEIAVLDRGAGMPADVLARIFEPYYRAPETRTVRGTGLGLAVVKALVEAHGGVIHVERARDAGTRVTFCLPAVRSLSASRAWSVSADASPRGDCRGADGRCRRRA